MKLNQCPNFSSDDVVKSKVPRRSSSVEAQSLLNLFKKNSNKISKMFRWLLCLLLLSFTIYSMNARVLNCEDGPTYWCISRENAEKCKKLNQCPNFSSDDVLLTAKAIFEMARWGILCLAMVFIVYSVSVRTARVLNCDDGPAYWCVSKKTAKKCNKENQCPELYPSTPDILSLKHDNSIILKYLSIAIIP
ncbi:hypothetical protein PV327_007904 [Microctonus hyperodae]|uniref:Saposin A-type domain-containing protein n=1 Tax=Microctonus hyperodae TaxID=165561 RepID=A0AA39KZ34_MICHY|nr:hypothetical protein PV327_007904 [Microctonus hyperodae]